jgi:hypothetical protein
MIEFFVIRESELFVIIYEATPYGNDWLMS